MSSGNQTSCYSKESCCKIGTSIKIFEHSPNTTQVKVILNNIQSYLTKTQYQSPCFFWRNIVVVKFQAKDKVSNIK